MGSDLRQRPDKVGHVDNVWKLRENGQDGLSVDRFSSRGADSPNSGGKFFCVVQQC